MAANVTKTYQRKGSRHSHVRVEFIKIVVCKGGKAPDDIDYDDDSTTDGSSDFVKAGIVAKTAKASGSPQKMRNAGEYLERLGKELKFKAEQKMNEMHANGTKSN